MTCGPDDLTPCPRDLVQLSSVEPGIHEDGRSFPVIDASGMLIGHAKREGDRIAIELIDEDMAKRLSNPHASVSVGYSVTGEPMEIAEAIPEDEVVK